MSAVARVDSRALPALVAVAIGIATLAVYADVRHHEFIELDDRPLVFENPRVVDGLSPDGVRAAFLEPVLNNWFPLTWVSYQLDVELHGLSAPGVLLGNVALHIAASLLLFFALLRMTRSLWPSAFVAAVFALHPLHVESVAWAAERKDTLSGLFWMLTLFAYALACERPSRARWAAVAICFGLGLLAKPMLVTLPFVLLLLDYWPLGRLGTPLDRLLLRRAVVEKIPLFAMAVAISVVTLLVQVGVGLQGRLPWVLRLLNACESYAWYVWKTVWPSGLAVFYPHPMGRISSLSALLSGLLLLAVTALAVRQWRRRPYLAVGWLWFVGTLVPVIGVVQVGMQARADRYVYLPMVGLCIALAWGAADWVGTHARRRVGVGVVGVVACVALGFAAHAQVKHWRSDWDVFSRALEVTERNYLAHAQVARGRVARGDLEGALRDYELSLEYGPGPFDILYEHGYLLAMLGRPRAARQSYEKALVVAEAGGEEKAVREIRARLAELDQRPRLRRGPRGKRERQTRDPDRDEGPRDETAPP